jgi:Plasmid replication region DNA-binding N-term
MSENDLGDTPGGDPEYSGKAILYRERGVSALDVQRAADALLHRGQKPSVAAVREHLGGGSPNTVGPLLDQYWRDLGRRLPAGPEALERVPASLARMTEALWLRSLDEARERAKAQNRTALPDPHSVAALEQKVSELTAALAESRGKISERESELLSSLRERQDLKEQVQRLMTLLAAEQELRAQDRLTAATQRRELDQRRTQILDLARRRLAVKMNHQAATGPAPAIQRKSAKRRKKKASGRDTKHKTPKRKQPRKRR